MRALGGLGLLSEDRDRSFSLTACGELLWADHPQTLRGIALLEEGPEHYAVWKHLCAIVREGGRDGFVHEFGHPIFVHTVEAPDYGAVFNDAMSSLLGGGTAMVLEALDTYDFSRSSHVCDVECARAVGADRERSFTRKSGVAVLPSRQAKSASNNNDFSQALVVIHPLEVMKVAPMFE